MTLSLDSVSQFLRKCYILESSLDGALFTLTSPERKIVEFANSVDPDEVVHNKPPRLDPPSLSAVL